MTAASFDYWMMLEARAEVPTLSEPLDKLRPKWMQRGACRAPGTGRFFPERGQQVTAARALCDVCVVREDCLAYALADDDLRGVWGGTSEVERLTLRREAAA